MPSNLSMAALCLATCSWIAPASAQAIYRCGDSYSQQRCPGGTLVQADDARSASQMWQTSVAAERDAKAAEAMEKARLKEEAKPAQAYIPPPKVEEPSIEQGSTVGGSAKAKKSAYFTATPPRKPGDAPKKRKKKSKKTAA